MQIATEKENSKLSLTVSGRIDTVTAPELELKEDEGKNGGIPIEEAL